MSKIYERENQLIIRFPPEIAEKIRESFANNQQLPMTIEPKIGKGLEFEVSIKSLKYQDKGVLVDLPTITESYKSKDFINLYKSNDISQMIWVGKTSNTRQCGDKVVCDSGLTPPTYDIRKDFHRKQPQIDIGEIQRVEKELHIIQSEFMKQQEEEENGSDDGKKGKKRYNKF
ncbi:unnamed protein product [Paramecium sonneborni]|uniref:TAFII55 protein conserved region domain-containing protein n=1 Tax=Paramecium sonneborni TaxID=65129 RepID=A0A8S1JZB5_9CILI|nr:unnamed protein product [Paramecium sonneborni]